MRLTSLQSKSAGFTIVELLIVVIVIAILATITLVGFNGIQNRARQSAAASATSQAAKQIALWQVEHPNQTPTQAEFDAIVRQVTGSSFQYSPGTSGAFCATVTTGGASYYTDQAAGSSAGACYGHSLGGAAVVVNMVPNPSFETNTSGWTLSGNQSSAHPSSGGYAGDRYYQITRTAVAAIAFYTPIMPAEANTEYTSSVWARMPTGKQLFLRYQWYDSSGAGLGAVPGDSASGNGQWRRYTQTATSPANTASVRVDVVMNTVNGAVGDTLAIDAVMLTKGSTPHVYADGTSPNWQWQGTPHLSQSSGPAL